MTFQFHKGAIKTSSKVNTVCSIGYFNSIKVRLKQLLPVYHKTLMPFQFHKGAIKTRSYLFNADYASTFQFHKGAIKTLTGLSLLDVKTEFQFHKGAIKTH